ncbi:retrovirus-related pol polyprotein from transposon TNT 1-94 [Tanacetum coccineum]
MVKLFNPPSIFNRVIDYVHLDLWGLSQVESLGGKSREFEQLCIESGIARNLKFAETPQQNRLAERLNKTLMDKDVKGYKLYRHDDESPKIVTSRNVVFIESVIYKDTLKDSGVGADKSVEELHIEVELRGLNNHTLEEDQTDQEDGDDEDA